MKIHGKITRNKKNWHASETTCGYVFNLLKKVTYCIRSNNTSRTIGQLFWALGKAAKNVGKNFNNPGRAIELAANTGFAAASKNPKLIAATPPDIKIFIHHGKGFHSDKIH